MDIDRRLIDVSQRIKKLVSEALDNYVTNIELRSAVGPAVDFACMSLVNLFREDRLISYLSILSEEWDRLDITKMDKEFTKTDEFVDLVVRASDNSIRTRYRDRIRLNCKILVGSISLENVDERHSAEDFLTLVADLSPVDIMLGLKLYEQQKDRPKQFGFDSSKRNTELDFVVDKGWHKLQETCRLSDVDFHTSLHKLSRAGLIKEIVGNYMNYLGGLYTITPTFQSLMKFIRLQANDPLFSIKIRDP